METARLEQMMVTPEEVSPSTVIVSLRAELERGSESFFSMVKTFSLFSRLAVFSESPCPFPNSF